MTTSQAMAGAIRRALVGCALLLTLAGCTPVAPAALPDFGGMVPPDAAKAIGGWSLEDALVASYPGETKETLRDAAGALAQAWLRDPAHAVELGHACENSVVFRPDHYAGIARFYTAPVFWSVHLNFAEQAGIVTPGGAQLTAYVGCTLLYWRDDGGTIEPGGDTYVVSRGIAGASGLVSGVPLFCFKLGLAEGGSLTTTPVTSDVATVQVTGTVPLLVGDNPDVIHDLTQWPTDFAGGASVWCPLDIAESMRAYVFRGRAETTPDPHFVAEIQAIGGDPAALQADIQEKVLAASVTGVMSFTNFMSVAASRALPTAAGVYPLMAYEPACTGSPGCGYGFRVQIEVVEAAPTIMATSVFTDTESPQAEWVFEQCKIRIPADGQPVYIISDGGLKGSGRMEDEERDALQGDLYERQQIRGAGLSSPEDCSVLKPASAGAGIDFNFWVGPSDLYIGRRPGQDGAFSGSLDNIWFDPNQAVPPN